MKKTSLVIMAAGIGSRFGGGIKQLEPLGPNGEVIMEYSIHDALEAGFNKVVFIIRKEMEDYFKEVVGYTTRPPQQVACGPRAAAQRPPVPGWTTPPVPDRSAKGPERPPLPVLCIQNTLCRLRLYDSSYVPFRAAFPTLLL